VGALPMPQLRAFIDKLLPSPSELERARAHELRAAGKALEAVAALRKAISLDAGNDPARLDLADLLIASKELDEAETLLAATTPDPTRDDRVKALRQAIEFARSGQSGPGEDELARRVASSPGDLGFRLQLASLHAGQARYREAMDGLLEIIRRDKNFREGEARKQMLAIFSLAKEADLVSEYRKKLASALY